MRVTESFRAVRRGVLPVRAISPTCHFNRHSAIRRLAISGLVAVVAAIASASPASATGWAAPITLPSFAFNLPGNDVSCSFESFCMSVGEVPGGTPIGQTTPIEEPAAEIWNGSSWAFGFALRPTGIDASVLNGVSCLGAAKLQSGGSASECYGVGHSGSSTSVALIELFSDGHWAIQPAPLPSGATFSNLDRVSCPSLDFCAAVGTARTASGESTLEEIWNGIAWTLSPQTVPNATLDGVSCTSSAFCVAVGDDSVGDLAEVYKGSGWVVQTGGGLSAHGSAGELTGVSCTSSTACVAVGRYQGTTGSAPQAEIYNGSSWSSNDPANPGLTASLGGVSCSPTSSGPTTCWAVGAYQTSAGENDWGEYWNGSSWQLGVVPNPASATNPGLSAVSCPASSLSGFCTAVGTSFQTLNPLTGKQSGFVPYSMFYTAVVILPPSCCRALTPKLFDLTARGGEKQGATVTVVLRKPRDLVLLVRVLVRHRLVTEGFVPLGLTRAGRSKIHWNLALNRRRLRAGRYEVSLHSDTGSVLSPATPPGASTLIVLADGRVRVGT